MHFSAFWTNVERKRKPIKTTARNIPIAHIIQPVNHTFFRVFWLKLHIFNRFKRQRTDFVHFNKPARNQLVNDVSLTAPAVNIAMFIFVRIEKLAVIFKALNNDIHNIGGLFPSQKAGVVKHHTLLVDWADFREVQCFSKFKVLHTAPRRDMHNARPFRAVHHIPRHNFMLKLLLFKFWETGFIGQPHKFGTLKFL